MKALVIQEHGDLDNISIAEIPKPEPRPGYVLVRTRAAALNHLELYVVAGLPGVDLEMPHVLGSDGAGTVESVGAGVDSLALGDAVMLNPCVWCGSCEFCLSGQQCQCLHLRLIGEHMPGTFAEFFQAPAPSLARIPEGVSFQNAAAFSLVFLTAWRMLVTRAGLRAGHDVFIHGIGGGVATAALQIAKLVGCRTFVSSSSTRKLDRARRLGADFLYDYRERDVSEEVARDTGKRGVDIVVDNVGKATWLQSQKLVRRGGKIVTCGATTGYDPKTNINRIFWKQIDILGSTMGNCDEYRQLLQLLGDGKLCPTIDRAFNLDEGKAALEYLEQGRQFGKVVLAPLQSSL